MATDLTKITGAIPYVTKVKDAVVSPAAPAEYVSEFVPLTVKVGDVLLNLSDGTYYEVTAAGTGGLTATLVRGDAQTALVVVAAPPASIDGKAPYTAITDLVPTLTVADGVVTGVSYADNRETPATGPDYIALANSLYEAVFPSIAGADLTAAASGTVAEKYAANLAAFKAALNDPTKRLAIQKWTIEGGLLALVLAGAAPFDNGDVFTDNVALDEGGINFSSPLAVAAKAVTGRNPQRGPFDYVVTPGSLNFAGNKAKEITDLASLVASKAYLPGRLVKVVVATGQEATASEVADSNVLKTDVPVYDKTAWKATESVVIGGVEVSWNGTAWVAQDLAPSPVTGLVASDQTATGLKLTWVNPTNPDLASIIVRRAAGATAPATASAGTGVTVSPAKGTTVTDSGLTTGTQYSYSVFARDTAGNTSTAVSVTTSTT